MDFGTFLWTTGAVFLTLATFSFLYKDNPFYKFAEHLVVGVSAGYFVIILWHNGLVPKLYRPLSDGDWFLLWLNSEAWFYVLPAILGTLMWTRFSRKYQWVSRWPMSMYIGIAVGVSIPLVMTNQVVKQLYAMMYKITWSDFFGGGAESTNLLDPFSGFSDIIVALGALAALLYFFFSKAHTGTFGRIASFGIWVLMIGFGASFGFTVMARISLFINRIQDVEVWGRTAWDASGEPNPNHDAMFLMVFWAVVAVLALYAINELRLFIRDRDNASRPQGPQI